MSREFIHTCYGCRYWYVDKDVKWNNVWPRKHCGIVDHWTNCEWWQKFKKEEDRE